MAVKEKLSPWARREFQRGQEKGIERNIFSVLRHRFGGFSESIEMRVRRINDVQTLDRLFELSLIASSMEEFEASLQ